MIIMEKILFELAVTAPGLLAVVIVVVMGLKQSKAIADAHLQSIVEHNTKREEALIEALDRNTDLYTETVKHLGRIEGVLVSLEKTRN